MQGPKNLGDHLLLSRVHQRGAVWEVEQSDNTQMGRCVTALLVAPCCWPLNFFFFNVLIFIVKADIQKGGETDENLPSDDSSPSSTKAAKNRSKARC